MNLVPALSLGENDWEGAGTNTQREDMHDDCQSNMANFARSNRLKKKELGRNCKVMFAEKHLPIIGERRSTIQNSGFDDAMSRSNGTPLFS
jgi:hypothetical protein